MQDCIDHKYCIHLSDHGHRIDRMNLKDDINHRDHIDHIDHTRKA